MHTITVYGWCDSWQCVADWTWGPNANNLATLLGAIATFAAAYLALRFSQRESKRRLEEDLVRARIAAIANAHLIADTLAFLEREVSKMEKPTPGTGVPGAREKLQTVFNFTKITYDAVMDDALMLLTPLPNHASFRIARAFAVMGHLRDRDTELTQVYWHSTEGEILGALQGVIDDLKEAAIDLKIALAVLTDAAKF